MFIADSLRDFRELFANKLEYMLNSGSLGAFILVLANSMQDENLQRRLSPALDSAFDSLTQNTPDAPLDDSSVFRALVLNGLSDYHAWRQRNIESWRINYNPLRALRPSRSAGHAFRSLYQSFNETGFHFDKPFLEPEILWENQVAFNTSNQPLKVLFNKFPFAAYHLLAVPDPEEHLPQFLTGEHHTFIWQLLETSVKHLPGLHFAYNSLGAGASVNHLHFQGFIDEPLAIESSLWKHRGGQNAYPLTIHFSESVCDTWKTITEFQVNNQPFNLLYSRDGCYVIQRKPLPVINLPDWGKGSAWAETCGLFSVSDEKTFKQLSSVDIGNSLRFLS